MYVLTQYRRENTETKSDKYNDAKSPVDHKQGI